MKNRAMGPCTACEYVPEGDNRPLSYLLSHHHLSTEELTQAAKRIENGERAAPSALLLEVARVDLTAAARPEEPETGEDTGLLLEERVYLVLGSILLTPLVGVAAWWGWRESRPEASRFALLMTLPLTAALSLLWTFVVF